MKQFGRCFTISWSITSLTTRKKTADAWQ